MFGEASYRFGLLNPPETANLMILDYWLEIRILENDLTTDLLVLQSHLDGVLDRVQHNSLTLMRFQEFEMGLMQLNSLVEMIEFLLNEAKVFFDLDLVSLCLVDEKGDIARFLKEDGYDYCNNDKLILLPDKAKLLNTVGFRGHPFLGRYNADKFATFYTGSKTPTSVAIIPLIRRGNLMGSLNLGSDESDRFIFNMATDFVRRFVMVLSISLENHVSYESMRRTSLTDTLTGINNRRFLEQRIDEEVDRCKRNEQPLSCLFLDIDFFKNVNDNYGHQAGDVVLAAVADEIKKQLRSNDVLSRYGGEEFVALLTNIDKEMAFEIAERIRKTIKKLSVEVEQQAINVTLSIGAATFLPGKQGNLPTPDIAANLIKNADQALYLAKKNGRDRVECAESVLYHSLKCRNRN